MTIEELLDREEIKQLRIAYAAHFDAHELDDLADLFTEDAVCEFGADYGGDWVGRTAIRDNYAYQLTLVGEPFDTLHVVTNPLVRLTGADTAIARWYLLDYVARQRPHLEIETIGGHGAPLLYLGVYEDECRKVGGRWRIARTRLYFLWPERKLERLPR